MWSVLEALLPVADPPQLHVYWVAPSLGHPTFTNRSLRLHILIVELVSYKISQTHVHCLSLE